MHSLSDVEIVSQVGLLTPEPAATQQLRTGQVGYVITGMKSTRSARLGDTWHLQKQHVEPLPGFKPIKSMVFAGEPPASCRPLFLAYGLLPRGLQPSSEVPGDCLGSYYTDCDVRLAALWGPAATAGTFATWEGLKQVD